MRKTAANVEMQGIEFQIVNDSAEASRGLDELAKSLANLKTSLGTGGSAMSRLAKNITNIKTAVSGLNTSKITELGNALNAFGNATASLSISSSIGNQIQNIANAVTAIPDSTSQKLNDLATSLKPLTELGKQQIGPFITQLKKIPELVTELETVDMSKFKQQMEDLANAMKPFADEMQKVSSGFSAFPSRIQRLITSTDRYNNTVRNATNHTTAWGNALKKISLAAIFRSGYKLLASAINKSSEYTETLNMFTVSMGEYAQQAYDYAQTVSEVLGIDPSTWMENQGVFNSIITGFGVASDKAYTMSKNLTQLAYDLSSFYNIGIEESMQKVQSGISGELEPLRRLGYDLSVARLQQEALNLGIEKSVSDMTQAEKAQLRYYAMMKQVTQVQGDMARTLEEPANQLRVLKAQVEQAARAFGNIFIPILNAVLPVVTAVVSVVRELISALATLFGVDIADSVDWGDSVGSATDATGEIADNMDSAASSANKLKQSLASFDELNVLTDSSGSSGSSSSGGGSSFDIDPASYDFLGNAVTEKVDAIKAALEPVVTWLKENMESILSTVLTIGGGLLAWKIAKSALSNIKKIVDFFKTGVKNLDGWQTALKSIGGLILIAVGVVLSYDAAYDIGKGTAEVSSYIESALGMIAATVGGALVMGPAGAVIGFTLSLVATVTGYTTGSFDAKAVESFSSALSTGSVSFETFANAAATAFTKLNATNSILASYGDKIEEQNKKIAEATLSIETYMGGWEATGTISKEAIGNILSQLDLIVTASEEKLGYASTILETTLVQAMKNAGEETQNTYKELLGMIYLLEANGNTTLAGWKTELALAEQKLAALDETSATYEENAAALMATIQDLAWKIAGIGTSTEDVTGDLKDLNGAVKTIDFSNILNGSEVATEALDNLTAATKQAYEDATASYQGQMDSLDEMFAYVDTNSSEWQAIYQGALKLGIDPNTSFEDVDAVKEFFAGYYKDIYQSQLTEIDALYNDTFGYISDSLNGAIEQAWEDAVGTTGGSLANSWETMLSGEISVWEIFADGLFGDGQEVYEARRNTFYNTLKKDTDAGVVLDALESAFASVDVAKRRAHIVGGFAEDLATDLETGISNTDFSFVGLTLDENLVPDNVEDIGHDIVEGVTSGLGDQFSNTKIRDAANSLSGIFDKSIRDAVGAHSPADLTIPHGEFLTMGIAEGLTDKTSQTELQYALDDLADMTEKFATSSFSVGAKNSVFKMLAEEMLEDMSTGFDSGASVIESAVDNISSTVFDTSEAYSIGYSFGNSLASGIAKALKNYSYPTLKGDVTTSGSGAASIKFNAYAEGGLVDAGQLFIAREAGAEMVGTIGGHTAVANNDQIVEAVSDGVYRAVTAAMSEKDDGSSQVVVKLYLDGKEIAKNQVKHINDMTRQSGKPVLLV